MAYDPDLADRIRALLADAGPVDEQRMFGGLAFMIAGRMVVAAGSEGRLMVRCDPARTDELLARPGTARPTMGTRTMSAGWVVVDADRVAEDAELAWWLAVARESGTTLTRESM